MFKGSVTINHLFSLLLFFILLIHCTVQGKAIEEEKEESVPKPIPFNDNDPRLLVFNKGLKNNWEDWGWAKRQIEKDTPARLNFSDYSGWRLANHKGGPQFKALRFLLKAPKDFGNFLEIRLEKPNGPDFPTVKLKSRHLKVRADGWAVVTINAAEINPYAYDYKIIFLKAHKYVSSDWISLDQVELIGRRSKENIVRSKIYPTRNVNMEINCQGPTHPIDPRIYGIAYASAKAKKDTYLWELNPGSRRWGGNTTSRYNWKHGQAWNTANDWYFRNVDKGSYSGDEWKYFLLENLEKKTLSALTVPMLGWVAKDTSSYSFPVSVFGKQQSVDPHRRDAGNGNKPNGDEITPGPPSRTSIQMGPKDIGEWAAAVRKMDKKSGKRYVDTYILGNEPMLWNSTHRDVHPQPTTYDELLNKVISYGTAIRKADPTATIAGPSLWGWPAYFFSAKDAKIGFRIKPDRRAHGDVPFVNWLLGKLKEHHKKTGVRILDLLSIHFYPQGKGVFRGHQTSPEIASLRIRSTRALWDPTYLDESWINEKVQLIPRFEKIIKDSYPGLGLIIGEWNFGAPTHMSGALAMAEAFGRFGQHPIIKAAYYWIYPPQGSFAASAFKAYRNYDGKMSRFLDISIPTKTDKMASIFASKNKSANKMVVIALNFDTKTQATTKIKLNGCAKYKTKKAFSLSEAKLSLQPVDKKLVAVKKGHLEFNMPPYSLTVVELKR